ncbi:hypothetical protein ACPWSR_07445 [Alloiococcus sp. CFN-8]|uniref:hypothetical protein n=1 Tax=Alloiococcus sp. CFN-8 TaxID=3416081 RepID=UPI003CE83B2B
MEIAYGILIVIAAAELLLAILGKNGRGELLVSLGKGGKKARRRERVSWFILLVGWSALLILNLIHSKGDIISIGFQGLNSILWIFLSIERLIRNYGSSEIREMGITLYNQFYKYSKLSSYQWLNDNVLRINYMNIFRQDDYYEIEIQDKETALKADEVLEKYIVKKA